VIIKEVERNDEEIRIARMLNSEPLKDDPRNHSVPLLQVIDDPDDDTKSYLVMPLLRPADHPPFDHVKEIVDFVDQLLEVRLVRSQNPNLTYGSQGLVFLHENGVAHR